MGKIDEIERDDETFKAVRAETRILAGTPSNSRKKSEPSKAMHQFLCMQAGEFLVHLRVVQLNVIDVCRTLDEWG